MQNNCQNQTKEISYQKFKTGSFMNQDRFLSSLTPLTGSQKGRVHDKGNLIVWMWSHHVEFCWQTLPTHKRQWAVGGGQHLLVKSDENYRRYAPNIRKQINVNYEFIRPGFVVHGENVTRIIILTDWFVAVGLPGRRFPGGHVEFVVKQRERFLARQREPREQRAVPDCEFDFDVNEIGEPAFDERRPHPIVDVLFGDVAHDIRPPVDALFEVDVALFDPLKHKSKTKY